MIKSIFAFAAMGGCAAYAVAQVQDGPAVYTRDAPLRADTGRTPVTQPYTPGWYGPYPGTFTVLAPGREYSLDYLALADVGDPVAGNSFGHAANVIANGNRNADGSLQFYSPPNARGLSGGASYARDDSNRDPSNRAWGMSLGYGLGPVTLRAAYQNRHVAKVRLFDSAGNNMEARNALVAANVRFSWGTAYAAYSANTGWGSSPLFNPDNPYGAGMATTPSTDSRDVLFGVAVPWGRSTTLLASFIHKNDRDRAHRDANEFALGASYTLTRRTDFYAAYSYIQNLNLDGIPVTSSDARGHTSSALSFGMRHAF